MAGGSQPLDPTTHTQSYCTFIQSNPTHGPPGTAAPPPPPEAGACAMSRGGGRCDAVDSGRGKALECGIASVVIEFEKWTWGCMGSVSWNQAPGGGWSRSIKAALGRFGDCSHPQQHNRIDIKSLFQALGAAIRTPTREKQTGVRMVGPSTRTTTAHDGPWSPCNLERWRGRFRISSRRRNDPLWVSFPRKTAWPPPAAPL